MAISPLPAPLQQLGGRRFSFDPPIRNVDHNEWIYRRASWTEVVVVNTRNGVECVIPRAFIGEVSFVDDPVVIVGLRRELEWREEAVRTYHRPVIELPRAVNQSAPVIPHPDFRAPVISIRLEPGTESRASLKLGVGLVLGAVGCLLTANIGRSYLQKFPPTERFPQTAGADDYSAIVRRNGAPASEHSVRTADGRHYRMLRYPNRNSVVVLAVGPASDSHYIGALGPDGRVLNAVTLPDGSNAAPLLRSLPSF
jgi:hypothetical protein